MCASAQTRTSVSAKKIEINLIQCMKYKDYYRALGVPRDADVEQIKKAYRKLARQYHPDVSKAADAEEKFKDAAEAYATLKNSEKRAAYDLLGQQPEGAEFSPGPQWQNSYASANHGFEDVDLSELLASLGRAQRGGPREAMTMQGRSFDTMVSLSLEDAHKGTTLSLNLDDGGASRTLEVKIPAGASEGQKLRLRGKGGAGRNGGADGDIYLHIQLAPHAVFRPDKHDLYFDLVITPWEAALGADLEVPTLDGPVLLTVPAGTRWGRKLRLRGRGLTHAKEVRGDLYAVVHIDIPEVLSERERALYQEMAGISTFNPRKISV